MDRTLKLKLVYKLMILVSVPIVFGLVFAGTLVYLLDQAEAQAKQLERAKSLISDTKRLGQLVDDAALSMGGYSVAKENTEIIVHFKEIEAETHSCLSNLEQSLGGDPHSRQAFERLQQSVNDQYQLFYIAKSHIEDGKRDQARNISLWEHLQEAHDRLKRQMDDMTYEARQLEATPAINYRERVRFVLWGFFLISVSGIIAAAFWLSRNLGRRLNILTENSVRLAAGEPLAPLTDGKDEIARLDRVFHKMADALAESLRKERAAIANAVDVICSIDANGRFSSVNEAAFTVLGYTSEELVGRRYLDLCGMDDFDSMKKTVEETIANKGTATFECRVIGKNAVPIEMVWTAQWSKAEQALYCVAHNITERKQMENLLRTSEERVRSIIQNIPVGVINLTREGKVDSVNPSIERIFGYAASELISSSLDRLFVQTAPKSGTIFEQLKREATGRVIEIDGTTSGGTVIPLEVTLTPFQNIDGERFLINVQDISERREIERLKQDFVAMISHDLRTPLGSILGTLTIIEEGVYGNLNDKGIKRLTGAQNSAKRLIELVNDLLDIEKLESGKFDLFIEKVKLSSIVDSALDSVRTFAEQHQVKLDVDLTDIELSVDKDRIVQVLINLLSNAVKFSQADSRVKLNTLCHQGFVEVRIIDEGRGIPENLQKTIFEKFKQVESSDGKRGKGSGLGLSICKAIVEVHGGTIGVESVEGKGSTFWVRLPIAAMAAMPEAVTTAQ